MVNIKLESMRLKHAKRFYEILNNKNFKYFVIVDSLKKEKEFIRKIREKEKLGLIKEFAILYRNKVVGGCGIKINQHRKFIGELGYFVDESYWGKGIATAAVKKLEKYCKEKLKMTRIEILMDSRNKASRKVAINSGYRKEGRQKKKIEVNGKYFDCYIYAKIL